MNVSASKVGLLSYCQWWASAALPERTSSEDADRGTRFHVAIAAYARKQPLRYDLIADDIRAEYEHACAWVDELTFSNESNVLIEAAFAWDPEADTAEMIGSDRDYSKAGARLPGTADLVLVTRRGGKAIAATVWDWKTGNSYESSPQLRALGLMVARTFGVEMVTCAALDVGPLGIRELCREDLDAFELATIAGTLADQLAQVPGAEPQPGAHCGELFCPAQSTCPLVVGATADLTEKLVPVDALTRKQPFRLTDPITTPEHAAWAVGVISLMGKKLDELKAEIKAKVPEGGWKLADGRSLEERFSTVQTSKFSEESAIALLRELGATDQQIEDLTVSGSYQRSQGLRVYGGAAKPRAKRSKAAA